jgi:hypothetical protein
VIAGFSDEYIEYMQGGLYRASYRPLNDAIIAGRIRGAGTNRGMQQSSYQPGQHP